MDPPLTFQGKTAQTPNWSFLSYRLDSVGKPIKMRFQPKTSKLCMKELAKITLSKTAQAPYFRAKQRKRHILDYKTKNRTPKQAR